MRSINKHDIEYMSKAALELLYVTNNLKIKTKEAMVMGEASILNGITVVEEVILELNPTEVTEEVIQTIIDLSESYINHYEEKRQHVDNNLRLGAMQSYTALDLHRKAKTRELVNF